MEEGNDKSKATVLIVDDDQQISRSLALALKSWGYETVQVKTIGEAESALLEIEPQIVLLDIELPDGSGLDLLGDIKKKYPETVVVMVTGHVDIDTTITALRGGAHDFIGKPIHLEELRVTLRNSVETRKLRREVRIMRRQRAEKLSFDQIIGRSPTMNAALETASKVAESDVSSVLLQGETGTGKDLFARAIHFASERRKAPYLAINLAALPANLIESELFGYEKGAFTDAKQRKEGLFEQADGGTLFLDEIGEMDVSLQAKLLRVLEEGRFRRIGGLKEIPIDVRVIAASNRDLKYESTEGNFRLDLYYRLSIIQIDIPPLRERGDDVLLLAKYYIDQTNQKRRGEKLKGLAKQTEKIFKSYEWLGNVRELRNVIERASILETGTLITPTFLPRDLADGGSVADSVFDFKLPADGIALYDVESSLVHQAVARTGGNLTQAAKLLDISRDQVRYRLKKDEALKEKTRAANTD
jgi:DNA-binding NtrC family response regulator